MGLNDSGGARIQEGVVSLDGYGHIFYRNSIYSGVIPQISVIMGPCAGGAVYSPAITDFVFMVEKTSQMFITGPKVIETVTGEKISAEDLGGARIHSSVSGNAHFIAPSEPEALDQVRRLVSFLPQNNMEDPPRVYAKEDDGWVEELIEVVPVEGTKVYDVREVIDRVLDRGRLLWKCRSVRPQHRRRFWPDRRIQRRDRRQPAQSDGRGIWISIPRTN